jgi:hypothetical protein
MRRYKHALIAWSSIFLLAVMDVSAGGWSTAVASWFGPGLYGNGMACGGTLTPSTWGVAARKETAACGQRITFRYRGNVVTATVVDRGPFIAGRTFDLTRPVKDALGCPDLCHLEYQVGGSDGPPAPVVRQAQPPPGPAALPQTDSE